MPKKTDTGPSAKERLEQAYADIEILELEEKLASMKTKDGRGGGGKAYRKLKEDLRDLRQEARAKRDGLTIKTIDGRRTAVEPEEAE